MWPEGKLGKSVTFAASREGERLGFPPRLVGEEEVYLMTAKSHMIDYYFTN